MKIRRLALISLGRLRLRLTVIRLVAAASVLFVCGGVAQAQDPQLVPVLQGLLNKYKGCILERYETRQDMISRGMDPRLSGLASAAGLQPRDQGVVCAAGNVCTLASRQATYATLQAQANRGDIANFEANLKLAIPRDCFQCQKHREWHTKHVHCTMDCGGNNGLTKGPCFEGCKAGVDVTKLVNDIVNDIHAVLTNTRPPRSNDVGGISGAGPGTDLPPGAAYTPHQLPFDLVWDLNTGIDANSLPLNPLWGYQVEHHGQVPDFGAICGPAFLDYERTLDRAILATRCTSQSPT